MNEEEYTQIRNKVGMGTKGLEAVIMPLINSIAPPKREPQCKLCKLIKQLVEDELGKNLQSELILRFVIDGCEKNPTAMLSKIEQIRNKLGEILMEMMEEDG